MYVCMYVCVYVCTCLWAMGICMYTHMYGLAWDHDLPQRGVRYTILLYDMIRYNSYTIICSQN